MRAEDLKSRVLNESYGPGKFQIARGIGCRIEDLGGRSYIDTTLGAGTHILGYAHPLLTKEVARQFGEGSLFTIPNHYTYEVVEQLSRILPQFDRFVFCNSGSESTMRAARIARAYTGRGKIAVFSGGWHGGNDLFLFDDVGTGRSRAQSDFKSAGTPRELFSTVVMLPYNCERAFEIIKQHRKDIAMVMIEPSQGSNPRDDVGAFLKKLRLITKKYGIVLCFDEIISGFRVALGGCQEHYGVAADMATYGKTLGAGLPIGMVAGTKKIMDVIKGGKTGKAVFMGGTFSANPLTMSASRVLLRYLVAHKTEIYGYLNGQGQRLRKEINDFCSMRGIPVRAIGIGSMSRLVFTDKYISSRRDRDRFEAPQELQGRFYAHLLKCGVYVSQNRLIFLSMAHKKKDIASVIGAIKKSLEYFSGELKNEQTAPCF